MLVRMVLRALACTVSLACRCARGLRTPTHACLLACTMLLASTVLLRAALCRVHDGAHTQLIVMVACVRDVACVHDVACLHDVAHTQLFVVHDVAHTQLFVVGGHSADDVVLSEVECYVPAADKWLPCAPLGCARSGLALCAV